MLQEQWQSWICTNQFMVTVPYDLVDKLLSPRRSDPCTLWTEFKDNNFYHNNLEYGDP